ncbi:tRNA preQ1(34) S-adenosylmethionine ribosyltransferase-isomerase QueA [Pajaroellobacter abortibovis]|uniref:S-adenosylmethionine:tRNA ribosyltransferase-isomerase n=1 Tax=Pajaroellobacter abortibovis TaxID=1882918 RepID=A0A1L6MWB5_9BACT|nr:tRNA preQ1(34) S-adenosylmethionine ribosyltransferase-isomerase QueA [Pajaroellobacter abortibovis]APR99811.1 tRNA preQ1(34) S-adenosylmethionine ribosyltransferase-isomerase QueA [Pajaroellobacter abortibovis]
MHVSDFHYDLSEDLIAQTPLPEREKGRLLYIPPARGPFVHSVIRDLTRFIPQGSLVITNDTRVIPARLHGRKKQTGGAVEILLLHPTEKNDFALRGPQEEKWQAIGKASNPIQAGTHVEISPDLLIIVERKEAGGVLEIKIQSQGKMTVTQAIQAYGKTPLPPYIKRPLHPNDPIDYQTIFAKSEGAVAAPTAGLHFTPALVQQLHAHGCTLMSLSLHIGLGTFQPVTADDFNQHPMHAERLHIPLDTITSLLRAKQEKNPIVAIGTTVVRALESAASTILGEKCTSPIEQETRLLIQPGYRFRMADMLFTNFHLPRSTLLALVCAFGGKERVLAAYREAVTQRYRFYSYGDAMLLSRSASSW